jgi:hypothetical protein
MSALSGCGHGSRAHVFLPNDPGSYISGSEANGTGRSAYATVAPPLLAVRQENIILTAIRV